MDHILVKNIVLNRLISFNLLMGSSYAYLTIEIKVSKLLIGVEVELSLREKRNSTVEMQKSAHQNHFLYR